MQGFSQSSRARIQLGISKGFPSSKNLPYLCFFCKFLGPFSLGDSFSLLLVFMVGNGSLRVQLPGMWLVLLSGPPLTPMEGIWIESDIHPWNPPLWLGPSIIVGMWLLGAQLLSYGSTGLLPFVRARDCFLAPEKNQPGQPFSLCWCERLLLPWSGAGKKGHFRKKMSYREREVLSGHLNRYSLCEIYFNLVKHIWGGEEHLLTQNITPFRNDFWIAHFFVLDG